MISKLFLLLLLFEISCSSDIYEDDDLILPNSQPVTLENMEFEPVVTIIQHKEKITLTNNLNCEEFSKYAMNCTVEAARIYNSSRKSPPMPGKMNDWCRALRHLTNCAIDWNSECKDVTDSHFNEESIKGHMHVVDNVCDNEWFLSRYDELPYCIESTAVPWEACYAAFKNEVDHHKNKSQEWTHYASHFYLCCARTKFRRCTLDALFQSPVKCNREHAVTMQKFTVIVSEGDVYQDCDHNMMYMSCPGGDPRPDARVMKQLMNTDAINGASVLVDNCIFILCMLLFMCVIK